MKRILLGWLCLFIAGQLFAQTFNADRFAYQGVISGMQNIKDGTIKIITIKNDQTYFSYTWIENVKIAFITSPYQYKMFLTVSSIDKDGLKYLNIENDNTLYVQGLESGTLKPDREEYTAKPTTKTITTVKSKIENILLDELNKSDDELSRSLILYLSNENNISKFSSDMLGDIALKYKEICNVPSVIYRLKRQKTEIWFDKYIEFIKGAVFSNTLELQTVKKSDISDYQYKAEFSFFINNIDYITINYYTNNDDYIDYNAKSKVTFQGKLMGIKSTSEESLFSIEVFE